MSTDSCIRASTSEQSSQTTQPSPRSAETTALAVTSEQSLSAPSAKPLRASSSESVDVPNVEKNTKQANTDACGRILASSTQAELKSQAIEREPQAWWGKPKNGQISLGSRVAAYGALRGQRRNGHCMSCTCQDCKRIFEEDAAKYFDRAVTDGNKL